MWKDTIINPQQFRAPADGRPRRGSQRVTPTTPQGLAHRIAQAALEHPSSRTRVGIDAAVTTDADGVAKNVVAELITLGVSVHHVRTDDFLLARSIRLETGEDDPDAGYWRWADHAALRREVLDPFAARGEYLPSLRDPVRDRPTRAQPISVPPQSILVLSGWLVLRTELVDSLELRIHLTAGEAAIGRRCAADSQTRIIGAWNQYLEWDLPQEAADLVIHLDHPDRPAIRE